MCSKMSDLHLALEEQLADLGFETLEQAALAGYEIDYENAKLIPTKVDLRFLNQAHEDWEKERDELVAALNRVYDALANGETTHLGGMAAVVTDAIDFIKRSSL